MTAAKDLQNVPPEGAEIRPHIYYHPQSPDASIERLRELAGIIKLTGPVPWRRWMDGGDDEDEEIDRHAGG